MEQLEELSDLTQHGRVKDVKRVVAELLEQGFDAQIILKEGLLSAMTEVGIKFKNEEIFVPEVLIAARAMNAGMGVLKPFLEAGSEANPGTVILGTVQGDMHDIGKNLVGMLMKGQGLEVIDLGIDVPATDFVNAAIEHNAGIIACSALLTTTMVEMKNVIEEAKKAGIRDKVCIMIGGAPVTESFKNEIGADIYTPDAASAAEKASQVFKNNA